MTDLVEPNAGSASLRLARTWYVIVGGGALLLTGGHAYGAVTAASRFDAPLALAGIAIGLLSLAAAAWVLADDAWRATVAWFGIGAALLPLAVAGWIALTSAGTDAQVLVGVPGLLGLAAGIRMAVARARQQ